MDGNGKEFEICHKEFLEKLLQELFFGEEDICTLIQPPTIQGSGSQYGKDISVDFVYNSYEYYWWFECKDYTNTIKRGSYADKILEACVFPRVPTCYFLVGTRGGVCNWFRYIVDLITQKKFTKPYIIFWEIDDNTSKSYKNALRCYPEIFRKIYPEDEESPEGFSRDRTINRVKEFLLGCNAEGTRRSNRNSTPMFSKISERPSNKEKKAIETLTQLDILKNPENEQ